MYYGCTDEFSIWIYEQPRVHPRRRDVIFLLTFLTSASHLPHPLSHNPFSLSHVLCLSNIKRSSVCVKETCRLCSSPGFLHFTRRRCEVHCQSEPERKQKRAASAHGSSNFFNCQKTKWNKTSSVKKN